MTTTTTFQGLEPGSKSSSRVLRPPGGGSNISFGTDEDKQATRKNKMASSIFAEPEDPHAHRRNNPPGGKPTGVLCGESSAPLRRCQNQHPSQNNQQNSQNSTTEDNSAEDVEPDVMNAEPTEEPAVALEEREESATSGGASTQAAGVPSGRRNPPGGKSSLILG